MENNLKPVVVCFAGLVGSGKSTVAKEFVKLLDAEFVSGDVIRVELRNKGETFAHVREIARDRASAAVKAGRHAVLDSDFSDFKKREELTKTLEEAGARVVFIHVTCELDTAIGRILQGDNSSKSEFWNEARSSWVGDPALRGSIVKLREMMRRIPHHYEWKDDEGGAWTRKTFDVPFCTEIDTTDGVSWRSEIKSLLSRLLV